MSELPPIIIKSKTEWHSGGVGKKPSECHSCCLYPFTTGFCPDFIGVSPKVGLLFTSPTNDDVNYYDPTKSDMAYFVLHTYVYPLGFRKEDLVISHVLRCKQKWDVRRKRDGYPTGVRRDKAEVTCRIYDDKHGWNGEVKNGGLKHFAPNLFLITFSPKEVKKVPSYHRQLLADMGKVKDFVKQGYKPLVLFGNEPAELLAPYIVGKGGAKAWRGHFWEGEYKFANYNNDGFGV